MIWQALTSAGTSYLPVRNNYSLTPSCFREAGAAGSGFTPDIAGDFDDQRQLSHLLVFAEFVTPGDAGKTALWAERQPFEWNVFGGLINAAFEILFIFQFGGLAGQQSKHHSLVVSYVAEWIEITSPGSVVLEEENIHVQVVEQLFRHGFIPTAIFSGRASSTLLVAAT